jgi:hypothetical protein
MGMYDIRLRFRGDPDVPKPTSSHPMKTRTQTKAKETAKAVTPSTVPSIVVDPKTLKGGSLTEPPAMPVTSSAAPELTPADQSIPVPQKVLPPQAAGVLLASTVKLVPLSNNQPPREPDSAAAVSFPAQPASPAPSTTPLIRNLRKWLEVDLHRQKFTERATDRTLFTPRACWPRDKCCPRYCVFVRQITFVTFRQPVG